ncbi:peroxidase [Daktulosphaira vitifoliae]|uniref:peroxidase n=2 Tax=Daktulosphaira vitifoliae TaxID=58002 RepID=UPI0021AA1D37|nr:peroxidase [Daktulosphaira vitifoliae]
MTLNTNVAILLAAGLFCSASAIYHHSPYYQSHDPYAVNNHSGYHPQASYGHSYQAPHGAGFRQLTPNGLGSRPGPNNFGEISTPPQGAGCLPPVGPCPNSKYRTIDGSCNNLRYTNWGTPNSKYARLLPPRYSDGIHAPPTSLTGEPLPSSRLVSIVMFPDVPIPDPVWTLITMTWGQIVTHDMSMSMGTTQAKRHSIRCCDDNGRLLSNNPDVHCFPITIPEDDPVFSKFNRECMNFVRSTTDLETGCNAGNQPAEQLVVVSHWMDASFVYGSSQRLADNLREGIGGRLRVEFRDGRPWPPAAANKSAVCDQQTDEEPCYQFGDRRANQNPQLTVLQILLLREHNRIATVLSHVNPHWDDETLYQEARRVLIAEFQHINYHEWLPIILGTENMLKYGLLYKNKGYTNDYKENVDPSVINAHAHAAFRYFHSSIQGQFHLIGEDRNLLSAVRLSDYFNRPTIIEQGYNFDHLTRGLATQSQEEVDPFFTSEITDFLFRNGRPFGRDLRAIDVQRGRDHGLASYNDYREFCGLPRAHKFEDFSDYIDVERIEKLALLYNHPDDVDLSVGGSLEAHVPNTLAGPTFLCLLTEQFYRTRVSDRYFYELGGQPGSFSPEQLNEIRKSSLSRIFCDNSDDIHTIQAQGFLKISDKNPLVSCNDYDRIPSIDLNFWKEESYGHAAPQYGGYVDSYKKK